MEATGERIRERVKAECQVVDNCAVNVTVSVGLCLQEEGHDGLFEVIREADKALYSAKREGRDRVSVRIA